MNTTVAALLDTATRRIQAALRCDRHDARRDARVLAAHAWQTSPAWLIAHDTDPVTAAHSEAFDTLIAARTAGHPVAHLVGYRAFYGRHFAVSADVLIPRPDTECLVDAALACIPEDTDCQVLELGTGSGCIAISLALARPSARVVAVDVSAAALRLAQNNARAHHAPVEFLHGDWFSPLGNRRFDVIVSNPPYLADDDTHLELGDVRYDPRTALIAGPDGLRALRHIIATGPAYLHPHGRLILEHGADQGAAVAALLHTHGYTRVYGLRDLAGRDRVSAGLSVFFTIQATAD